MTRGRCWVVLGATFLGLVDPAYAQVNIERLRRDSLERGFAGSLGLDLAVRAGNVELVKFDVRSRGDYAIGDFRTFVIVGGDFGWQGGEVFSNEALAHARQVFRTEDRVKPEFFQQVNYDKARLLVFRGLAGGGLRFTLLRVDGSRLWLGTAYMFEREHLDLPDGAVHEDRTSSHRLSSYLSSRLLVAKEAVAVWTVYVQPRFDEPRDMRVLGDLRFGVEISRAFAVVTSFLVRYDSRPPDEVEPWDVMLRTGFQLTF